jgi:deazaflavin-dependent oxidoreductase (nitroreductase family)
MASLRSFFRILNRFFLVPLFRLGLGSIFVNPLSGYIMVLVMQGHKTGKIRRVPVNYAIDAGRIYCLAGWGRKAHWYMNLQASPELDVILPGTSVHGRAEEVADPIERLRIARKVMRAGGFISSLEGINPASCSDERLAAFIKDMVLLRIQTYGVGSGPADPGGWAWILSFFIGTLLCFLAAVLLLQWIR